MTAGPEWARVQSQLANDVLAGIGEDAGLELGANDKEPPRMQNSKPPRKAQQHPKQNAQLNIYMEEIYIYI